MTPPKLPRGMERANAALIAAAPEMYAALAAIVEVVAGFDGGWPVGSVEIYAARAALAKARGEK